MMNNPAFAEKVEQKYREWTVAVGASVLLHIVMCIMVVFFSYSFTGKAIPLKSIDVDLSYLPMPKGKPEEKTPAPVKETRPPEKKSTVSKHVEPKKTAIALKKKIKPVKEKKVDPKDTIEKAIKRLEKNLAASQKTKTDPIAERIKRLEKETGDDVPHVPGRGGQSDNAKHDSAYEVSLIDRYRHNVGMEIREKWAFSESLAAGQKNLLTKVTFEVMPNGEIRDVRITRKSGNDYMDSSATMAIVKSSPVRPHPPGLNKPFIEVKLSFTPEGLD